MVKDIIKGVIILVIAMLVFSYIVSPGTKNQINNFFSSLKESFSSQNIQTSPGETGRNLCIEKVKEDLQIQKIKSPVDFSYSILEVKEFDSMGEAEDYRKKYTTFNLLDPLCEGQKVSKTIAVLFEIRYTDAVEPLTGMGIDKETGAKLCNEKGEYLIRGYSWECKEKLKQEEQTKEEFVEESKEEILEEEEKPIVDSMQIVSKSVTSEDSCKIQCTAACDKKGHIYHSSEYGTDTACKCNCAAK